MQVYILYYRSVSTNFMIFLSPVIYCLLVGGSPEAWGGSPDSCDCDSEITLYLASSQAPKSISLHRREQKGKNFASSDCS